MANVLIEESTMTSIANAIRTKTGTSDTYLPSQMPTAIANIPTGESPTIQSLSVTENGTYTAPSGVDGYSPVTVTVPSGDPHGTFLTYLSGNLSYFKSETSEKISLPIFNGYGLNLVFWSTKNATGGINTSTFYACKKIKYLNVGKRTSVHQGAFNNSSANMTIVITSETVPTLTGAPQGLSTSYIYVKDSLVNDFHTDTNWSAISTRILGYGDDRVPSYSATDTYSIGAVCKYNGKFYGYCKDDLTSSTGNPPSGTTEDNAYWEYVGEIEVTA